MAKRKTRTLCGAIDLNDGAVVDLTITSTPTAGQRAPGEQMPSPHEARGMLDPGANVTLIDGSIAKSLSLAAIETGTAETVGQSITADVFEVSLRLGGTDSFRVDRLRVAGTTLNSEAFSVIVGRDVLNRYRLIYDGPAMRFELRTKNEGS